MRTRIIQISLPVLTAFCLWQGCRKSDTPTGSVTPFTLEVPQGFPAPIPVFRDNPLTREAFELGRRLFYDGRLAKDGVTSCASCHQQFAGFATFDHALSHGVDNASTTRNAPGLANLAWYPELHWDGGINHLEVQPLSPITAANEMGETVAGILKKLNADSRYREMTSAAFGSPEMDSQRMLKALAQFTGTLVSGDSKYDRVRLGTARFTPAEEAGYAVFKAKCASCHREPLFTDHSYRNIGLPMQPGLDDVGRMRITKLPSDSLKFRVPSLRNVMVTGPYGHDGRFFSVGAVIEHYRTGIRPGPTLDPLLRNGLSISLNEKSDLVQFLGTLTDTAFLRNPRYAEPR
jgi:cytochrome c peroxidase